MKIYLNKLWIQVKKMNARHWSESLLLVQYIFADTMRHAKETNAYAALANTCLVTKAVLTAK